MRNDGVLLAVTLAVPLVMLALCLSRRVRERMPALLPLAPMPAIAAALATAHGSALALPPALFSLTFAIDAPGAMLLGTAALLWIAAGAYARVWLRGKPGGGRFAVWWLTTLTGNLGVFIAADLVSFYVFFTLVSLAAYGLVTYDKSSSARRAGAVYIALTVLSEALLLMSFVLLAAAGPDGSLLIRDAVAALSTSPGRDIVLALVILGFGIKIGLVPLHVWMPLAYPAAPIPAAAALSGAAVNAGVIGLIRFLPFETAMPGWGEVLAVVGLISAFYGVAVGITQTNPKAVLAYSSVSQMGFVATVAGMGLATGDISVPAAVAFYAMHHALVKGGLFLSIGVTEPTRSQAVWLVLLPATVLALGLGGLPLTGGLAKLMVKAPLGDGAVSALATLSAIGSTLLMLHFLHRLWRRIGYNAGTAAPTELTWPWLAVAVAAVVVPAALYPVIANTSLNDALTPSELWAALWPICIGALLSVALWRWGHVLPRIRRGDVLVLQMRVAPAFSRLSGTMEKLDERLRQWPVAGLLFLVLTIILAGAMLAGR